MLLLIQQPQCRGGQVRPPRNHWCFRRFAPPGRYAICRPARVSRHSCRALRREERRVSCTGQAFLMEKYQGAVSEPLTW